MLDFSLNDVANFFTGAAKPTDVNTSTSYTSFDEERRRNMEEVANAPVAPTQPEQQSLGPAVMARAPGAGRGFINPKYSLTPQQPAVPVEDQSAYNASIAQQESGNNPNIGYHDRNKGTAWGQFGITDAAYEDARKLNPNLPADKTQMTPAQQTEAMNAFTQQNAGYLKNYGVPVNEGTLSAAHLLGAKGLKDFMDTGYISPAAARANGGEENLRRIVNARLGGQAAPASGAAQAQPAPTAEQPTEAAVKPVPYTGEGLKIGGMTANQLTQNQDYQSILNSNSQESIAKLAFDKSGMVPISFQRAAQDKLYQEGSVQQKIEAVKPQIAAITANPTPQAINRAMNDKDTGSVFRAIFYGLMGAKKKEEEEWDKISPKVSYNGMTVGDNSYSVKTNANTGEVLAAWDSQGNKITDPRVLGEIAAGGVNPATAKAFLMPQTSGSPVTKTIDGQLVNGIQIYDPVRKSFYVQYGNKRDMNPQGWTSATQNVDQQATLARQKAIIDLQKKWSSLDMEGRAKAIEETNKALVGQLGTNAQLLTIADVGGQMPTAVPQAGGAPAAAAVPQGGAQTLPVAPGTPAATGQVPPAQQAAPGAQRQPTLAEIQAEEAKKKQAIEVGTATQKEYQTKFLPELNTQANQAGDVRTYRKAITDVMTRNPALIGFMQGSGGGYDETRNILRDLVAGNFKDQADLSARIAKLNFPDTDEGRQAKAAWSEIENLQRQIAPSTLKAVAGAGAVSEAEQKANRETIGDVTRLPAYTAYSINTRDQFQKDLKMYERDWAQGKGFTSDTQHSSEWAKEKKRLQDEYDRIYRVRAEYIAKHGTSPSAVVDGFKLLPVPEYNPGQGWFYGGESERARRAKQGAERPPLGSFVR